ncbi:hypothetical protein M9458_010919, partial [Cirrhinus mrigala]
MLSRMLKLYYVVFLFWQHQCMTKPSSWRLMRVLLALGQCSFKKISMVLITLSVISH